MAAGAGFFGTPLPMAGFAFSLFNVGAWALTWKFQFPIIATFAMVLSGIGSNIIGGGVHSRLYYADPTVTARVSSLVTVGQKVAEIAGLFMVTRIADGIAPSLSFMTAGVIMTIATLLVFGLRRRSSN